MSMRTRVARLEGVMAGLGVCPVCRGLGRPAFRVQWDPEIPIPEGPRPEPRPERPEPQGCPRCGEVRLTIIRVVYENRLPGGPLHERRW